MRKQQPGMSPYPGHHPSSKEMQLFQQHLMYKHLQELQRQQQFQQIDHGAKQHNLLSQVASGQTVANHFPSLLNGVPVNDMSSYMLHNEIIGSQSKLPNSTQMFTPENTNWGQARDSSGMHASNRLMLMNNHGQSMQTGSSVLQQVDQSLYGTPISSSRGFFNQHPRLQGNPNNFADAIAKAGRDQLGKVPVHSGSSLNSFQNDQCAVEQTSIQDGLSVGTHEFQGKGSFVNSLVQNVSEGAPSGNFQRTNLPQYSTQTQEFQNGQEQAYWSGNLEEKAATAVGPSHGGTSLDPTEERILFGTDDDGDWAASFVKITNSETGGYQQGDSFQGNDQLGAFPSLQSGSWSALMQEAVQSSSSEKGLQEEWSGLNFTKAESSIGNTTTVHHEISRNHANWGNSNDFQSKSSVRSKATPLFNTVSSSPAFPTTPTTVPSMRTAYEENSGIQGDYSHGSFPQSSKDEQNMQSDQNNRQKKFLDGGVDEQGQTSDGHHGVWSKHIYEQSVKSADSAEMRFNLQNNQGIWPQGSMPLTNINGQPVTHGLNSLGGSDNRILNSHNGGNLFSRLGPVRSNVISSHVQSVASSKSNVATVTNPNNLTSNQEMNRNAQSQYQNDLGKNFAFEPFVRSRGENMEEFKQSTKAKQVRDSSLNSTAPSPSMSDSQTSSGMSGWKPVTSRRFQPHPMENLGTHMDSAGSPKDTAYSQITPKLVTQQSKIQEHGYLENSQLAGHGISNLGQTHSNDMQKSSRSPEESQGRSIVSRQTSQNMLDLLQKVDNSSIADGSVSHPFHNQSSAAKISSLRLGSPSQREQVLDPDFGGDKNRQQSASPGSHQSLHHVRNEPQKEKLEGGHDLSAQNCNGMPESIAYYNSSSDTVPNLSYLGHQLQLQRQQQILQQQLLSRLAAGNMMNQSVNLASRNQADVHASINRVAPISHTMAYGSQSGQTSTPTISGRLLPFRLNSSDGSGPEFPSPGIEQPQPTNVQPTNVGFHHLKSSSQQLPLSETEPASQADARSGIGQQIRYSTMLQNVLSNSSVRQIMSEAYPQNLINSVQQSIRPVSDRDKSSGSMQREDDQGNQGAFSSEIGTCSHSSQQGTYRDSNQVGENSLQQTHSERGDIRPRTASASEEQEQSHFDRNSAVPTSAFGRLPHGDVNRGKQWPNTAASDSDGSYGRTILPSTGQPNYSLLQQMQAMKGADSNASRMDEKRLKGEIGPGALHAEWKAGQGYIYGQNTVPKVALPDELGRSSHGGSSSDVRMLSFSSRGNEEKIDERTSQLAGRDGSSQSACLSGQPDVQNKIQPFASASHFTGRTQHPLLTPEMARSWFEQYRKYKNGQILGAYADQNSAKAASQQGFPAEVCARVDNTILAEQRIETSQFVALSQVMCDSSGAANESSQRLHSGAISHDMFTRSRKRKTATSELLPWHQVVLHGIQRVQSISLAERDWAQASNRLPEKAEDAAEMTEDGLLMPRAKRRLTLTTQLMQQLFSSIPASILSAETMSIHESLTYFLAKSTLGDACGMASYSACDSGEDLEEEIRSPQKLKKASEAFFSKVVEDFMGRSMKLETDFLRLDKKTSVSDIRLEWQEVERFSLINRLGKFHVRSQSEGAESSSASENAPRRIPPQRYVTAFSMPSNVPEGVLCLSL